MVSENIAVKVSRQIPLKDKGIRTDLIFIISTEKVEEFTCSFHPRNGSWSLPVRLVTLSAGNRCQSVDLSVC